MKAYRLCLPDGTVATKENVEGLLIQEKLTVNHRLEDASDRGINIHAVLENWVKGIWPNPNDYPEPETGYVKGLCFFLNTIAGKAEEIESEVMVGSLEHRIAGRPDLWFVLTESVELITRIYPKKDAKIGTIPAGRYLLDLKTSKHVYDKHFLQTEAYECCRIESGYRPSDERGIIHVTADGQYELVLNSAQTIPWTFSEYAAVRACYAAIKERWTS